MEEDREAIKQILLLSMRAHLIALCTHKVHGAALSNKTIISGFGVGERKMKTLQLYSYIKQKTYSNIPM